uniref:Ankyrin repeat and SOCS box containing 7 n=1 Tax=Equus caballus TaxID=9796 RepID=A0A9L0S551_HORSE
MLHHHCRRNPELQEELQIQAAVAAGDVHTVRKMLEQGYSPNGRDANGWTLLHFSAARGKERCVRVFLEHGGLDKLTLKLTRSTENVRSPTALVRVA